jgi:hypothetical protein
MCRVPQDNSAHGAKGDRSSMSSWSQRATGGTPFLDRRRQPSLGGTSRMNREIHVRICERLGVKFPGPTRRREQSRSLLRSHNLRIGSSLRESVAIRKQWRDRGSTIRGRYQALALRLERPGIVVGAIFRICRRPLEEATLLLSLSRSQRGFRLRTCSGSMAVNEGYNGVKIRTVHPAERGLWT